MASALHKDEWRGTSHILTEQIMLILTEPNNYLRQSQDTFNFETIFMVPIIPLILFSY